MSLLATVGTIIGVVIVVAAAVAFAIAYGRSKFTQATIALLRTSLDVERGERVAEQERCKKEIADLRAEHAHELGQLRGRVTTLTDDFLERLVTRFAEVSERNRNA